MSVLAIILVIGSCFTHAWWNLVSKQSGNSTAFFLLGNSIAAVGMVPVAILAGMLHLSGAPPVLWHFLVLSGFFQALYFAFLAKAYLHGDVSLAYPVIRASPLFVLAFAWLFLEQAPTFSGIFGLLLAVLGCFLLHSSEDDSEKKKSHAGRKRNVVIVCALLAALASTGYTLADDVAMELTSRVLPSWRGALSYGCLLYLCSSLWLLVLVPGIEGFGSVKECWREERFRAIQVGFPICFTYCLVLWAYAASEKVAYVAGLRQFSVVLGVLGGVAILGEPAGKKRIVASIVILAGLILVCTAQ